MKLGLDGKVALVTGGSSGMGLAIALELAAEGAHVAIGARDPDRLMAAHSAIAAVARGKISATSVDIADAGATRRWIDDIVDEFGALHIVVISGGSPPFGTASHFELADYRAAVAQILDPAVSLTLDALPHLRAAGWGRVLFVASETAIVPIRPLALSGVARAALVRFAQGIAADVGRDGITVNVLAPGGVHTPLVERLVTRLAAGGDYDEYLAAMGKHNALGRVATPQEIAAVAVFLASERASFVTGAVHMLDGGASLMGYDQPHLHTEPERHP